MKSIVLCLLGLATFTATAESVDEIVDHLDDTLTVGTADGRVRARLSGLLDLEGYAFENPAPGLLFTDGDRLFNPRLTLFLDAQLGGRVYLFGQARLDRGFDPAADPLRARVDELALRLTADERAPLALQIGKFATVVGNWVQRHDSWTNPFITAPLPYENLTGIWDAVAAPSSAFLLRWAHVQALPSANGSESEKYLRLPILWGPSYATGLALSGRNGPLDYAVELKNAALSSRPDTWAGSHLQWRNPTVSGHLGYRPNAMWNLGVSVSTGTYLQPEAQATLTPGRTLGDYRQTVVGQDLGFAWHHLQLWSEVYAARFAVPGVGHADTLAYYVEAKYQFAPRWFGALRWNRQLFGRVTDETGAAVRWGRDLWRMDAGAGCRISAHAQFKLQFSLQQETGDTRSVRPTLAGQFTVRF